MPRLQIGTTDAPADNFFVSLAVSQNLSPETELLFKLVTYSLTAPSEDEGKFLGLLDKVWTASTARFGTKTIGRIRNLGFLDETGQRKVRIVPPTGLPVYIADDTEILKFLPSPDKSKQIILGKLESMEYALPIDVQNLFSNAMILAGIGHGKSRLAILLAYQLKILGNTVVVIDPTGEWKLALKHLIESSRKLSLPTVEMEVVDWNVLQQIDIEGEVEPPKSEPKKLAGAAIDALRDGKVVILDLSKTNRRMGRTETALRAKTAGLLERQLFEAARETYRRTRKEYGFRTFVFVEEAHGFVPRMSSLEEQQECIDYFAVATKESRKYGLGHVFIDQTLASLSRELQAKSYFLGGLTNAVDRQAISEQLGSDVSEAAQTTSQNAHPSWIAYGYATPISDVVWKISGLDIEEYAKLGKEEKKEKIPIAETSLEEPDKDEVQFLVEMIASKKSDEAEQAAWAHLDKLATWTALWKINAVWSLLDKLLRFPVTEPYTFDEFRNAITLLTRMFSLSRNKKDELTFLLDKVKSNLSDRFLEMIKTKDEQLTAIKSSILGIFEYLMNREELYELSWEVWRDFVNIEEEPKYNKLIAPFSSYMNPLDPVSAERMRKELFGYTQSHDQTKRNRALSLYLSRGLIL